MKKTYENTFIQGRELTKKLMAAAAISAVLSIVLEQLQHPLQSLFFILTLIIFLTTIYVIAHFCRCPHCGKRILVGVLTTTVCPSCRRSLITGKKPKKSK